MQDASQSYPFCITVTNNLLHGLVCDVNVMNRNV